MQRLALLSGACPFRAKDAPTVRLSKGKWKLEYEGVLNTTFYILLTSKPFESQQEDLVVPFAVQDGHEITLHESVNAKLVFYYRGNEQFVSVMACKVA
jgi:hypothetical protein